MLRDAYDVVIIGASFSGLTLAHHLAKTFSVLVVEAKPAVGSSVESTGLITERTRELFASFFPIDRFLTNQMRKIAVIAPDFETSFISETEESWIHQTDTRALMKELAATVPANVDVWTGSLFVAAVRDTQGRVTHVRVRTAVGEQTVACRVLVGADGGRSKVAEDAAGKVSRNKRFLFGFERLYYGELLLGADPDATIAHYWFGKFSLGYGGWISPTIIDGKKGLRIGLAKLPHDRGEVAGLLTQFTQKLIDLKHIHLEGDVAKPVHQFGSLIPMGGVLPTTAYQNTLLIGDAAGYCGAFAADGIKGSLASGIEAAHAIEGYLARQQAFSPEGVTPQLTPYDNLPRYYVRQRFYRLCWDLLQSDAAFARLHGIVAQEKQSFLHQFCDSKDKRRSLLRIIVRWKYVPELVRLGFEVVRALPKALRSYRKT